MKESDSPQLIAKCSNLQRYSQWYAEGHQFNTVFDLFSPLDLDWEIRLFGFHFGHGVPRQVYISHTFLVIPYWSIVIPLTLLSAWLLFSKPRAKKA